MATTCYQYTRKSTLAPDATEYFTIGPTDEAGDLDFSGGAITVTAVPAAGTGGDILYMEVIQAATRRYLSSDYRALSYGLDVVVRNNSHASDPEKSTITEYEVYVSVVRP